MARYYTDLDVVKLHTRLDKDSLNYQKDYCLCGADLPMLAGVDNDDIYIFCLACDNRITLGINHIEEMRKRLEQLRIIPPRT